MYWNELANLVESLASDESIISRKNASCRCTNYLQHLNADNYTLEIPLVGIEKNNVSVTVEDNKLLVVAKSDGSSSYAKDFKQSWILAEGCDSEGLKADLKNGLLKVVVPKTKKDKNKKVVTVN